MGYALQIARGIQKAVKEPAVFIADPVKNPGESEALKTGVYIYSHLLGMKIYPIKDPITGRITKVVTEDGLTFTEEDIVAFRAIRDAFGIEEMIRVVREKKNNQPKNTQQKETDTDRKLPA